MQHRVRPTLDISLYEHLHRKKPKNLRENCFAIRAIMKGIIFQEYLKCNCSEIEGGVMSIGHNFGTSMSNCTEAQEPSFTSGLPSLQNESNAEE